MTKAFVLCLFGVQLVSRVCGMMEREFDQRLPQTFWLGLSGSIRRRRRTSRACAKGISPCRRIPCMPARMTLGRPRPHQAIQHPDQAMARGRPFDLDGNSLAGRIIDNTQALDHTAVGRAVQDKSMDQTSLASSSAAAAGARPSALPALTQQEASLYPCWRHKSFRRPAGPT